jgi:hypothetical protein
VATKVVFQSEARTIYRHSSVANEEIDETSNGKCFGSAMWAKVCPENPGRRNILG